MWPIICSSCCVVTPVTRTMPSPPWRSAKAALISSTDACTQPPPPPAARSAIQCPRLYTPHSMKTQPFESHGNSERISAVQCLPSYLAVRQHDEGRTSRLLLRPESAASSGKAGEQGRSAGGEPHQLEAQEVPAAADAVPMLPHRGHGVGGVSLAQHLHPRLRPPHIM